MIAGLVHRALPDLLPHRRRPSSGSSDGGSVPDRAAGLAAARGYSALRARQLRPRPTGRPRPVVRRRSSPAERLPRALADAVAGAGTRLRRLGVRGLATGSCWTQRPRSRWDAMLPYLLAADRIGAAS
ncbi:hypothetical protein HBB16_08415 [Pseudonocardia sp. MCCB 268]|nr:hypothetical protein [Pseudonocardia cytotoxica]